MGAAAWALQDDEISMEELHQSWWCIEALFIRGHGLAWLHTFRDSGLCISHPETDDLLNRHISFLLSFSSKS
jgi:hypothetical protein